MCARKVSRPDNRPQVVGIFNIIQKDKERRFPFFFGTLKDVLYLGVFIGCRISNHTLMFPRFRHLAQPFFRYKPDNTVVLLRLPLYRLYRPVLASVLNKNLVNGLPRTKCLDYRMSAFNCKFLVSHLFYLPFPLYNRILKHIFPKN